jgi:hypothetical protein
MNKTTQHDSHSTAHWTTKARDARRITAAQIKYMRKTAGYTWADYETDIQRSQRN